METLKFVSRPVALFCSIQIFGLFVAPRMDWANFENSNEDELFAFAPRYPAVLTGVTPKEKGEWLETHYADWSTGGEKISGELVDPLIVRGNIVWKGSVVATHYGRGDGFFGKMTFSEEPHLPGRMTIAVPARLFRKVRGYGKQVVVRVTNEKTKQAVVARINDTGRLDHNGVDLNSAVWDAIGKPEHVTLEVLDQRVVVKDKFQARSRIAGTEKVSLPSQPSLPAYREIPKEAEFEYVSTLGLI